MCLSNITFSSYQRRAPSIQMQQDRAKTIPTYLAQAPRSRKKWSHHLCFDKCKRKLSKETNYSRTKGLNEDFND